MTNVCTMVVHGPSGGIYEKKYRTCRTNWASFDASVEVGVSRSRTHRVRFWPNPEYRGSSMRVMVLVKASKESEAGVMPTAKLLAEMGKFNQELLQAGVMLAGDGLHPSSRGKRVKFSGQQRTVIDGPLLDLAGAVHGRGGGMAEARTV